MKRAAILLALLLAGCGGGEAVHLARGESRVQCGPYSSSILADERAMAQIRLRDCVQDYQRQGYERVPR